VTQPTSEELDPIFRVYGQACFMAQNLEAALRMLLVLTLGYEKKNMSMDETVRFVESETSRDTLRRLFDKAKQKEYFTSAEHKKITAAIELRNFVVHGYWDKHALLLSRIEGRQWVIEDLGSARDSLHEANGIVNSLCDKYLGQHDLSMDSLKFIANSMWEGSHEAPPDLLH
jgi:hypothetical protein